MIQENVGADVRRLKSISHYTETSHVVSYGLVDS